MQLMTGPETRPETADFSGFYAANFGWIAAQLHAYLGDRWEAQDLTQEAFCRAFDRWHRISSYERPEAWVRQVAWNLATNRLRHLRTAMRHLARQREERVEGPSPDRIALVSALAKLPSNHRLAIVLHHIGELSTSEIATQQGVAEGTVRSWLSRGRSQLAEQLTDAPMAWEAAPAIDWIYSRVRQRRATRRATLAVVLAVLIALPIAIVRGKGSEPPFIGPTEAPTTLTPSPSPSPSPAQAAKALSSCSGKPLDRVHGAWAAFVGGEPTGRYLVGEISEPAGYRPVLWTDGVPSTFTLPGKVLTGIAVNSQGVVAGSTSRDGHSGFSVWTYHNGRLTMLLETEQPNDALSVIDINGRGDILLRGDVRAKTPRSPAIRVAGPAPVIRDIPLPEGASTISVSDLGEDGTIVGSADSVHAVVWTPLLAVRTLPSPGGWKATASAVAGEWAVGTAASSLPSPSTPRVDQVALRWNLRTGQLHQVPEMRYASAVTPHGWVLGSTDDGRAVLDMDGMRVPIPATSANTTAGNAFASFVSDDGRIVGGETKMSGSGANAAISWTCS